MQRVIFICAAVILSVLTCTFPAGAKTVELGVKTGHIVAAEFSTAPLEIGSLEQTPYPNNYKKKAYAIVVLKMHPRRSISPLDYSLTINRNTANCVAAACNMEPLVSNPAVLYPENNDFVRLVFIFDGNRVKGNGKTLAGTLTPHLKGRRPVAFNLTDLGSKPMSNFKTIPAAGLLK